MSLCFSSILDQSQRKRLPLSGIIPYAQAPEGSHLLLIILLLFFLLSNIHFQLAGSQGAVRVQAGMIQLAPDWPRRHFHLEMSAVQLLIGIPLVPPGQEAGTSGRSFWK